MIDLKVMEVTYANKLGNLYADAGSYESHLYSGRMYYIKPNKVAIGKHALEKLEAAYIESKAIHESNITAIENNKTIVAEIIKLMKSFGIDTTKTIPKPSSRARFPPKIKVNAGFIEDLRIIKVDDGFSEHLYNDLKSRYTKYLDNAAKELVDIENAEKAKASKEKAERKANLELAQIILRYNLDPDEDWTWEGIYDVLIDKDQRARLALYMMRNRNDWTDGYDYAEHGLNYFTAVTDEDKEIEAAVSAAIDSGSDGDIDGRIFRDMKWGYDAIFSTVQDQQLVEDLLLAFDRTEYE